MNQKRLCAALIVGCAAALFGADDDAAGNAIDQEQGQAA